MTRIHVVTTRVVDETTGEVTLLTSQTPFTPEEEAAADLAAQPTVDMVVAERERRLTLGFDYNFGGDGRGVHRIGTTAADMIGWDEVTKATQAMIALGAGSTTLTIVTNTGPATITAIEWQQILLAASAARQPIWAASFALEAMSPIPSNYTDDSYWA